jgi:hypothetical protein
VGSVSIRSVRHPNKFVIPTEVVMGLRPTQGDDKRLLSSNRSLWKRRPPLCHPERTRISYYAAPTMAACAAFRKVIHRRCRPAADETGFVWESLRAKDQWVPHISLVFREMWDTTSLHRPVFPPHWQRTLRFAFPTSREKRARYGAPIGPWQGEIQKNNAHELFLFRKPHIVTEIPCTLLRSAQCALYFRVLSNKNQERRCVSSIQFSSRLAVATSPASSQSACVARMLRTSSWLSWRSSLNMSMGVT